MEVLFIHVVSPNSQEGFKRRVLRWAASEQTSEDEACLGTKAGLAGPNPKVVFLLTLVGVNCRPPVARAGEESTPVVSVCV